MNKQIFEYEYQPILNSMIMEKVGSWTDFSMPSKDFSNMILPITGKRILIISLKEIAIKYARYNSVIYLTSDINKYKEFIKEVNHIKYNDNDNAFLINNWENWKEIFEGIGMPKFDIVIMNPPYNKNLHLKILEEIIPIADKVINISPIGYLLDIPAVVGLKKTTFQKYENSISKHISNIDYINAEDANKIFDIASFESLGISELDNNIYDFYKSAYLLDNRKSLSIFNKTILRVYNNEIHNILEFVKLSDIHGHPNSKDEFDICTPQYKLVESKLSCFLTINEKHNFHNSLQTIFMKYLNLLTRQGQHLKFDLLPIMKDYTEPWTNQRFCEFFEISGYINDAQASLNSEWEIIINAFRKGIKKND